MDLRAMITTDGSWTGWKFEFDAKDGQGTVWHQGRGTGPLNSLKERIEYFSKKRYTVIGWRDYFEN